MPLPRRAPRERPPLWAEGRQHPRPDLRTFARAALILSREGMAALLDRCAASAQDFGAGVAAGRWVVPPERLGRTGRLLPPHGAVGRGVLIGAEVLAAASQTVLPLAKRLPEPAAPPPPMVTILRAPAAEAAGVAAIPSAEEADLAEIRALLAGPRRRAREAAQQAMAAAPLPQPLPQSARAAAPAVAAVDPGDADLAAVRALMAGFGDEDAAEPPAPAPPPRRVAAPEPALIESEAEAPAEPAPAAVAAPRPAPRWLVRPLGALLGWGLMIPALPYGVVRAVWAHLTGEDLRKLA